MDKRFQPGDFVACYVTNTDVVHDLLTWGMVIEVSATLKDILVLDKSGDKNWWPSRRWTRLKASELYISSGVILA